MHGPCPLEILICGVEASGKFLKPTQVNTYLVCWKGSYARGSDNTLLLTGSEQIS